MDKIKKVQESNQFYNWYHGLTDMNKLPEFRDGDFQYFIHTSATSGIISTQHFGEKFDRNLIEGNLWYEVYVYPPENYRDNKNVTLHFLVEQISSPDQRTYILGFGDIDPKENVHKQNFTPPVIYTNRRSFGLARERMSADKINGLDLELMPGFKFKWHFTGDGEVKPDSDIYVGTRRKQFVK